MQVDCHAPLVISDADDATVLHGDIRGMNFTAENVDKPRVLEE